MRDQPHMIGAATPRTTRYAGVSRGRGALPCVMRESLRICEGKPIRGGRLVQHELTDGASVSFRPSDAEIRATRTALAPWRALAAPRFYGIDNVPASGSVLLVGNHSIFGLLDPPLMVQEIFDKRGRFVRSLAENAH